jgi:hypothetical protein
MPESQHLTGQLVLALEVVVERRFGDADVFEYSLETDGVDTVGVKQVGCPIQEPFSRRRSRLSVAEQLPRRFVRNIFAHRMITQESPA